MLKYQPHLYQSLLFEVLKVTDALVYLGLLSQEVENLAA